jgi:hypothetical protein
MLGREKGPMCADRQSERACWIAFAHAVEYGLSTYHAE